MNVFSALGKFFKRFGKLTWTGLGRAAQFGLDSGLVEIALQWVKVAAQQQLNNEQKRAFVIKILVERFPAVPESIIRLAVELAVQILKKQTEKL